MKKLKKRLVLAVYVVLLSTGWACANSVYLPSVLASDGNGSHDKGAPVADTRVVQDGDRGVVHEEQNPHVDSTAPVEACLKEGEACNPLNDRCCEGYYCFGGLVPTCVRKP
ncbi:hypothetical protein GSbR_06190 [Geobacter sp. SVR]|nr:hypothetical protein GSVR_08510 [Geobacter sp. SVR]GCF84019.1 hypothetical protein GSbR_06190 [Geobacter sp. SVR]